MNLAGPPSSRTYQQAVRKSAYALLVFGFAEEIAMRFVPAMLRSMHAPSATIGLLGTVRDLCDAALAYPGGRLNDRWGPTRTLRVVGAISILGYVLTAIAGAPWLVVVATILTMAWPSMGIVATFDVVARGKRDAMRAFSLQAMLRRIPMVLGPILGAALVGRWGSGQGTRAAIALAAFLAVIAVLGFVRNLGGGATHPARPFTPLATLRTMHPRMKMLLACEVLVRFGEGLPDVFIVVFVLEQAKRSAEVFGALIALRALVSIVCYLPGTRLALATRREVAVLSGFLAYAAFPLVLAVADSTLLLVVAFALGGLREIGEPARKSLLVELAGETPVGDVLGTYLLVRGVMVAGAGLVGGVLYAIDPALPFFIATCVSAAGAIVYAIGARPKVPAA
jgi:MFS family permease